MKVQGPRFGHSRNLEEATNVTLQSTHVTGLPWSFYVEIL
jgi:hypothetical protein